MATAAPPPGGGVAPSSVGPVDTFERVTAASVSVSGGDSPADAAAKETYARYGNRAFDLSDPKQKELLIAASPQIDNLATTTNDANRCGAAAMLNGMILGGDPAASARAIERVAADHGVAVDGDFAAAVGAMKDGTLTPKQAAAIQDGLFQIGKTMTDDLPPELRAAAATGGGLTPLEMSELAGQLRAAGAFGDACQVKLTLADVGKQNHWIVSVTDEAGRVTSADSAPRANGLAGIASSDTTVVPGEPRYLGDVSMEAAASGLTTHRMRMLVDGRVESLEKTTAGAPRLWE